VNSKHRKSHLQFVNFTKQNSEWDVMGMPRELLMPRWCHITAWLLAVWAIWTFLRGQCISQVTITRPSTLCSSLNEWSVEWIGNKAINGIDKKQTTIYIYIYIYIYILVWYFRYNENAILMPKIPRNGCAFPYTHFQ